MANVNVGDARTRLLRRLRRRRFERFRYRGADALVVQVPEGEALAPVVQAKLAGRADMRIYPVPGGYLYKWPHTSGGEPPAGFVVEAGGWDHEHCDGCNRTIKVNGSVWLTERGSFYKLCPYCYRRVRQLAAEPDVAPDRRPPQR